MNCIYSVSGAFTYSEFQRAKINGNAKISLKNFSIYLLGHLQEKYQRSEKHFSQIQNFKGAKFNRLYKIFQKNFLSTNKTLGQMRFG